MARQRIAARAGWPSSAWNAAAVGMQDALGLMFYHNVFTVQFMYDRPPPYIVAFYPALSQVAHVCAPSSRREPSR